MEKASQNLLIKEYDEEWIVQFNNISSALYDAIPGIDIDIVHVGSTAVPGLAAKSIIDLDIVYKSKEDFNAIKKGLSEIGYFHNGDQGIPDREVFKRHKDKMSHPVLDQIDHHLYVCPYNSKELQRHITFRDHLRENEMSRNAYRELKIKIADEALQDKGLYALLKEEKAKDFIQQIIDCSSDNI
jgi:GrpB-like predicted nucleotidyltransferase (UPF0157 family)